MVGVEGCSVLLMVITLQFLDAGSGQTLGITSPSGSAYPNPENIVVGVTRDLVVQVQCSASADNGSLTWMYRNGTEVADSLQAFGISQGGVSGGGRTLRASPASLLEGNNNFLCSDAGGNSSLNVSFNLVTGIFFTTPVPLEQNGTQNIVDLCSVPDIPEATVTAVEGNDSFCLVETARGNFRSTDIANGTAAPAPPISISLSNASELVLIEGQTLNSTFQCEPQQVGADLIQNGSVINETSDFGSVARAAAGIYQCLSSPNRTSVAFLYVIVAFLDTPTITPPSTVAITLGVDTSSLSLLCSVTGTPLPRMTWKSGSSNLSQSLEGVQEITAFMMPARSTLTLNTTSLPIGDHVINCLAELDGIDLQAVNASVNISVGVVFQNINIFDNVDGRVILSDPQDGVIILSCTVESSLPPDIEWMRNNQSVIGTPPILTMPTNSSMLYTSTLNLTESDLVPPVEVFRCFASLNISGERLEANRTLPVGIVFANISISPMSTTVEIQQNGNGTLVNLTCTIEASLLTIVTFSWDNGMMVSESLAERIATSGGEFMVQSVLVVDATTFVGQVNYTCTASPSDTRFNQSLVDMATITSTVAPSFVVHPLNQTIEVAGRNVTLFCEATGFPIPSITWEDGDGNIIRSNETFRISASSGNASSSLSFVASGDDNRTRNGSTFLCVAMNVLSNRTTSRLGRLVIAGPPGSPGLNVSEVMARSATVSWSEPFSLINITNYNLSVIQVDSNSSMQFNQSVQLLASGVLLFQFNAFLPFSLYEVSVQALNMAGAGPLAVLKFRSGEAVPGPPLNLASSATLNTITLTWTQTLLAEQNGILTQYTVQYQSSSGIVKMSVGVDTSTLTIQSLQAGTLYVLRVAAHNGAGMGPFSISISQNTTSIPPAIQVAGFMVDASRKTNSSTIPILLPDISNGGTFNHYWVIVLKVNDAFDASVNPLSLYANNNSFVFYSAVLALGQPYVVAEISATNYAAARSFLLGSREANTYNDIDKYDNGPLQMETSYTVFVWGFSPLPQNGVTRRQTTDTLRQYDAFSSSAFLPPVATTGVGLSTGVVVAIVIVIVVIVCVAIAIVIVVAILCARWRYSMVAGPPPSRKGSMRLRDQDVIQQPINSSNSFQRTSLRSSFRRNKTITLRHIQAEAELQNLNPDDARLPMTSEEFPKHVKMMHKNTDHLFSDEYEIISIKSPSLPHVQCILPVNVNKNRYANINCYDNSRVALKGNVDITGSDYINANYIDGYNKCTFVAAQGPLANTTHDFWRMIWEQGSCCIIMLTNLVEKGRVKCHQYWPEVGSMSMGDLTITLIEVQQLAYYTIRTFRISKGTESREVKQFHYTGWPDFGVPEYPSPVISFINRIDHFKRTTDGPDLIHCSAGVGRTGTLISIQCMMHMLLAENKIDIFNFVLGMRQQRNYMVQTERQYIFIHDTILEYIRAGDTEVCVQDLHRQYKHLMANDPGRDCSRMEKEYSNLRELQNVDTSQYHPAQLSVNVPKNRHAHILPYDRYRVRLLLHPGVHGSDYINACYLDGYHRRHQYIVTQGPMNSTVTDFWRMVWEHRCSCIIMLCLLEENGEEQSVCYWPTDKIRQHGDMFIEQTSLTKHPTYTQREMTITNAKINESRSLKHFHYEDWLEERSPASAVDIIDLIGVLQKAQNKGGGGPIIVHDNTGIGRGGTFVVLSSILEQLKVEGIIDPFLTVHSLRQQQPGLVTSFEQYRFCYQAVMEFLDSFDHYANFD